jgi:hypothetical protein
MLPANDKKARKNWGFPYSSNEKKRTNSKLWPDKMQERLTLPGEKSKAQDEWRAI